MAIMVVKKNVQRLLLTVNAVCITILSLAQQPAAERLRLWYNKPAAQWEEMLPLGNGRLGMMPDGGVLQENLVLNEITLWSGAPQDANNKEAYKKLPEIQRLLLEGKNDQAQALIDKDFICTGKGSGAEPFGCFQTMGRLSIAYRYEGHNNTNIPFTNYSRQLLLDDAMATCSYQVAGVTYKREYFTSFGTDVGIIKLSASKPGMLNLTIGLSREEKGHVAVKNKVLEMTGQLENGYDGKGMQYIAQVAAKLKDGELSAEGNTLVVKKATEVVLVFSAKTSFRSNTFREQATQLLTAALTTPYVQQQKKHIANYRKLFHRQTLYLGAGSSASNLTTDKRLDNFYSSQTPDNQLTVLFYQFSRYLSISSTRVGLLPPNLQGLWAHQVRTPWNGDYHLDVNVQMNHWGVEPGNLSELNLPLAALVKNMVPHGERTAKAYYNAEGWIAHVITNPWMFTEPGESASWGVTKSGSGWLCNNLWDHYVYSNDKQYLKNIYPVLKGSAQFYNAILVKEPKTGWLVTSPSSSPENSFFMPDGSGKHVSICMGATIDNQIIRELFNNVITASETLGVDAAFRKSLQQRLQQIPPPGRIASDGRLMEWLEEYKETEKEHRHISHLYGLYPANLITPSQTPDLAEACKKSLNVRGDDGPSWAIAYKQLFWARLHDGNRAYKLFREIMKPTRKTDINYGAGGGVYPNLLSAGPPFQIDGNFGAGAGIAEMLLQSHEGFIHFIPAIPDAWKTEGAVTGMKARGNITVDFAWKDGRVTGYRLLSPERQKVKLKINGDIKEVFTDAGSLRLAGIFSDSMVLQRNSPLKIWGWAGAGETVTVHFHNQTKVVRSDATGRWQATLAPEAAGGPYNLSVKGKTALTLRGILVGDLWVCSGQSNMEMPVKGWGTVFNADEEIATANYPRIRLFTVEKNVQGLPADDIKGGAWQTCTPQNVPLFSAVGYFFGRELHRQLHVPIGLIHSSWGGTDIESWISHKGFESDPYYHQLLVKAPEKSTAALADVKTAKDRAYIASLKINNDDIAQLAQWKNLDYADASWEQMQLPGIWENQQPGPRFDGIIWFRKEIMIDEADAGKTAVLQLGMIDDMDETYVNGIKVGGTRGYNVPRSYQLDGTVLKKGKNVIVVRVEDTGGGGGIYGEPGELSLTIDGKKLPLAGPWKFRIQEARFGGNGVGPNDYPSLLYNGMIHPLEKLPIKGVIWYQGENNASRAVEYRKAMPLLIKDWRARWQQNNMPFYFVQLASFSANNGNSKTGSTWAELREAQAMTTTLPNTGMAITIDVGDARDIHPRNKQDVGKRLAYLALQKTYTMDLHRSSPTYKSMQVSGNKIIVQFNAATTGLTAKPATAAINGFEIAGTDQQFYPAQAVIEGTKVILSSPRVAAPVAVRYAWVDDAGHANLFSKDGLPAAPFRTDNFKTITANNKYSPIIN